MSSKPGSDNIYLNVTIGPNPDLSPSISPAIYDQTLTNPILAVPDNYYMSVLRFSIPLDEVPLLIFPIDASQNNPNQSYLGFGIRYLGVSYFQPVIYVPNNTFPAPTAAGSAPYFSNQQLTTSYYFVYSIRAMLDMFNTTIASAMAAAGLGASHNPYFTYDSANQLLVIHFDGTFVASGALLYVNSFTINYVTAFDIGFNSFNDPNGFDYYFILHAPPDQAGPNYFIVQEYSIVANYYDLRRLIITSATLPITAEISPYQNPDLGGLQTGVASYLPIVTDFLVTVDNITQVQSIAVYNPTSQYRLIDMISGTPVNRINLRVLWEDKLGNIYQLYIGPTSEITIKIGFFTKGLYLSDSMLGKKM